MFLIKRKGQSVSYRFCCHTSCPWKVKCSKIVKYAAKMRRKTIKTDNNKKKIQTYRITDTCTRHVHIKYQKHAIIKQQLFVKIKGGLRTKYSELRGIRYFEMIVLLKMWGKRNNQDNDNLDGRPKPTPHYIFRHGVSNWYHGT